MSLVAPSTANLRIFSGFQLSLAVVIGVLVASCASIGGKKKGPEPQVYGRKVEFSAAQRAIRTHIPDRAKSEAMLVLVDQAESQLGALNRIFKKYGRKNYELSSEYGKGPDKLNANLRDWQREMREERLRLVNTFFRIKKKATEEEWSLISSALFNSLIRYSDHFNTLRAQSASDVVAASAEREPKPARIQ